MLLRLGLVGIAISLFVGSFTMENNLPKGWIDLAIKDFAFTASGGTPSTSKREYWENGTIPWINSGTLKDDEINEPSHYITELGLNNSSAKLFPKQTVVIALTGATTGRIGLLNIETSTNQSVTGIFPSKYVLPKYVFYFLKSYREEILRESIGSAQPHINKAIVDNVRIPIAPIPEQRRIVEKLDALMARIRNIEAGLEEIPTVLKNFRQSVLAAAVSGGFTEQWRNENGLIAKTLLNDIYKERYEYQINVAQKKKSFNRKKFDSSYQFPKEIQFDRLDIPKSWSWAEAENLTIPGRSITYGIIKPGPDFRNGVPYVRVMEMKTGIIDVLSLKRCDPKREAKFEKARLKAGDLLISKDGTIGKVAIVPPELEGGNITQHVLRFSVNTKVNNKYIALVIQSDFFQNRIKEHVLGVALQGINVADFKILPVPVPPRLEQDEIVRLVEELFHFAASIEVRYQKARDWFDKLPQSILAKAFRGELVSQNEDDESTSVLLEKIAIERNLIADKKQTRQKRISKAKMKIIMASLTEIIKEAGNKIDPKELWEKSQFQKDIDAFYAALKEEVEKKKTIKQNPDKSLSLS